MGKIDSSVLFHNTKYGYLREPQDGTHKDGMAKKKKEIVVQNHVQKTTPSNPFIAKMGGIALYQ